MSVRETYYCDECGRAKAEANHWFRAKAEPGAFLIGSWDKQMPSTEKQEVHLCSEACAVKAMSRVIGTGNPC